MDKIGDGHQGGPDSITNSAYRSGSRLGNFRKRRGTIMEQDSSSRVSGARSTLDRVGKSTAGGKKDPESLISNEIDYFGRADLVERAMKATNYRPLAFRDQKSMIKLA